ncbi:MAG: winged helix-turn-helix domain-containing protein [Kineosporiaceae bacterium]
MVGATELNFPNPVTSRADLYFRDRELHLVQEVLSSAIPRPVVVQGERVMGKTSLLNVISEWAAEAGLAVLSLPHVTTREQLIEEVLDGMAAESRTSLFRLGLRGPNGELALTTLNAVSQAAVTLARQADKTFLLCLDELDSMLRRCPDEAAAEDILGFVQYLVSRPSTPAKFVCTTTRSVTQILGSDSGHFMQGARIAILHPWSAEQSRIFVDRIIAPKLTLGPGQHDLLFEFCGGHPYLTKGVLQALLDDPANADHPSAARPASEAEIRRAARIALTSPEVTFTLNNIMSAQFTAAERSTLMRAADRDDRATSDPDAVHALVDRGYLSRRPDRSVTHRYALMAEWLRRHRRPDELPAPTVVVQDQPSGTAPATGGPEPQHQDADPQPDATDVPPLLIDLVSRRIFLGTREVQTSPQGYRFLACLIENAGRVVDRSTVTSAVWPSEEAQHGIGDGRLDALVHRLREQLGAGGQLYIQTRRGHGWILDPELVRAAPGPRADAGQ